MGSNLPKPFVKWAGGKGQLLDELLHHAPPTFRNYWEPFVGGGALFFALKRTGRLHVKGAKAQPEVHLWDGNLELMQTWGVIRDDVQLLIDVLADWKYSAKAFAEIRAWDRQPNWHDDFGPVMRAARFIYLNRTCYNGLYRVNAKGQFNAPFGKYTNPTICNAENLRAVSKVLKGVEVLCEDFSGVSHPEYHGGGAQQGDFAYLDPPYVPTSDTADFTAYTAGGFTMAQHAQLADIFDQLARKKVHVMLTNSDTPWVRERYAAHRQIRVQATRQINSKKEKRGPVTELIIVPR